MKERLDNFYPSNLYEVNINRWYIMNYNASGETKYCVLVTVMRLEDDRIIKLFNTYSYVSFFEAEQYLLDQLEL